MVAETKAPLYQDFHEGASVCVGRFSNDGALSSVPAQSQFAWLHRFYLILDDLAAQYKVYKLNGGPQGFVLATNVAEPDENHAATLLACVLQLTGKAEHIRVPGGARLDLSLALDSGPLASGLLGKTSLTYQVVGRSMAVAEELAQRQSHVPILVADGMRRALPAAAAAALVPVGSVQLRCSPDAPVHLYTLPHLNGLALDGAVPAPQALPMLLPNHAAVAAETVLGAPTPLASEEGNRLASLSLSGSEGGDSATAGTMPPAATF